MKLSIVEGVAGYWHYHLADEAGYPSRALCRRITMATSAPLSSWGYLPSHMPTSYCRECDAFLPPEKRHFTTEARPND